MTVKVAYFLPQATKAIHELLVVPNQQFEVQTFFASLFVALLFQISSLVTKGSTMAQDELTETKSMDTVRYSGPLSQCANGYALCISQPWHPH